MQAVGVSLNDMCAFLDDAYVALPIPSWCSLSQLSASIVVSAPLVSVCNVLFVSITGARKAMVATASHGKDWLLSVYPCVLSD